MCFPARFLFLIVMASLSPANDEASKSTELHSAQREMPLLGAMKAPVEVDWSLIAQCNDEQDALLLCVHLSRLANEEIARRLGIDKSHWTRIMQGRGNLPARKRTPLMSICGNIAPIQFEAMRFGRQLKQQDTEKEERELKERLARIEAQKRVMQLAA